MHCFNIIYKRNAVALSLDLPEELGPFLPDKPIASNFSFKLIPLSRGGIELGRGGGGGLSLPLRSA